MANLANTDISTTSSTDIGIAHNVEISYIKLTNWAGEKIDIREIFIEMNIMNSIFENCIFGTILLVDANSLLTRFPIIGEETIEIQFNTPGNIKKNFTGAIWNVEDITPSDNGSKSTYVLKFISKEALTNKGTFVSKSYTNTLTAEEIVKDVMTTYLNTTKTLNVDACIEPKKTLIIPYMRPYEAIDFLKNRVKAKDSDEDYFLFFERFDGIYFKNFSGIISSPLNKANNEYYYMSNKFGNQGAQGLDMKRIISLKINSKFDTIQKIEMGMLQNEAFEYSFDDKRHYSNVTSYSQVSPYIANKRMNTSNFIDKYARGDAQGLDGNITSFKERRVDQNFFFQKPAGSHLINRLTLAQISLTITIPGDSTVDVGDVITVHVPEFTADDSVTDDPHLSGRYIIGSVRNTFVVPDKHVMQLDLYRDGFSNEISSMSSTLKATLL